MAAAHSACTHSFAWEWEEGKRLFYRGSVRKGSDCSIVGVGGREATVLSNPHHPTPAVPVTIRLLTFSWHLALLCWTVRPALALVTKVSKMVAQCFPFHSVVLFMLHSKTHINTTDTSSPPSLSVGRLACLWHAWLFDIRLITARGLAINKGHVERDCPS